MLNPRNHTDEISFSPNASVVTPARSEGKLLVVDDEASLRRSLHTTLFALGFDIAEASSGEEALALCRIVRYDAVLLDITMPGKGGIETCRELRLLLPRIVIIMLSVNDDEERKVRALEAGADDYVTKPFHMRELVARIHSALRRSKAVAENGDESIAIGDIEVSPARRLVVKAGKPIHLTPKEFDLLHYLMTHAGIPVKHARLLNAVWGVEYANQVEYLRTFVRQLRKKLEDHAGSPQYLLTESHIGYRFVDAANAPRLGETQPTVSSA
jgi:two-component system KDP operon response regulator KdpE